MKKIFLILGLAGSSLYAVAQQMEVESARIYLREGSVSEAKASVDKAATNETTKNKPEMWAIRAAVYDTILHNKTYASLLTDNAVEQFVMASRGCLETDSKKRYEHYCSVALIQSAFDAYNKASDYLNKEDYNSAIKYFQYVVENIKLDKTGQIVKNNLNENNVGLTIADVAYRGKNYSVAKSTLQKLIDEKYANTLIYSYMSEMYMEEGDTAKALEYISIGRERHPSDKALINQELNIYLQQGKTDVLVNKINQTLANDPENATLQYVRGNIYEKYANTAREDAKTAKEEADKISKKARNEKVPATKAKLDAQAKQQRSIADSLNKQVQIYFKEAAASYGRVIEITPENTDGYFAMGALTNNFENAEIIDRINSIQAATQAEYDKKYAVLKQEQDVVVAKVFKYFEEALAIAENMSKSTPEKKELRKQTMISILESIKMMYGSTGDEAKYKATKQRIEDIENGIE